MNTDNVIYDSKKIVENTINKYSWCNEIYPKNYEKVIIGESYVDEKITILEEPKIIKKTKKNKQEDELVNNIEDEKEIYIVIFNNPMLNYINENTYKIACCFNYENSLKLKLQYFIEPCEIIYVKKISELVNNELTNVITIKNVQDKIMKIFKNYLLIDFRHNYISSIVITHDLLLKKIKKLENEIHVIEEYIPNNNLKIDYSKTVKKTEIFESLTSNYIKKILKMFNFLLKTRTKYKLMAYTCDIFKYYGENIWCFDIVKKSSLTPESSSMLISEFIPNLKIHSFDNFKESKSYNAYNILIFLLIYNNQNKFFIPNNETHIFIKIKDINDLFDKLDEMAIFLNKTSNELMNEMFKIYPSSKMLF